jgi:hypothetical protein
MEHAVLVGINLWHVEVFRDHFLIVRRICKDYINPKLVKIIKVPIRILFFHGLPHKSTGIWLHSHERVNNMELL